MKIENAGTARYIKHVNHPLSTFLYNNSRNFKTPVEKLGFEVFGPIVMSFCQWIHKISVKQGYDKLFFMARDMKMVMEVYHELYPNEKIQYLYASRQSLKQCCNNNYSAENLLKYLNEIGFAGKIAVIDLGWIGTSQYFFESIANSAIINSDYLYYGNVRVFNKVPRKNNTFVCLENRQYKWENQTIQPLLEAVLGAYEPKAIDYCNGNPAFSEVILKKTGRTDELKSGAKQFCKEWDKQSVINPYEAFKSFLQFERNPSNLDIKMLEKAEFDEENEVDKHCIVSYQGFLYYVKKPARWFSDLSHSAWKGAFFKKSFLIHEPFYFVYVFLNGIRLMKANEKTVIDNISLVQKLHNNNGENL